MSLTPSLKQQAINALKTTECAACGGFKRKEWAFCRDCFHALPDDLRFGIYRTFSDGFAEVYDEALDWLRQNKPSPQRAQGSQRNLNFGGAK